MPNAVEARWQLRDSTPNSYSPAGFVLDYCIQILHSHRDTGGWQKMNELHLLTSEFGNGGGGHC